MSPILSQTSLKNLARNKHSSLFCLDVCDEEKVLTPLLEMCPEPDGDLHEAGRLPARKSFPRFKGATTFVIPTFIVTTPCITKVNKEKLGQGILKGEVSLYR